jgi:hypothetical protein
MEGKEYRDNLAEKLHEIRNSDPENVEKAHTKAEGYLEAEKEKPEYETAEDKHRREAMETMPFNMATFEQYVGMKQYTSEELAQILAGDKEPSESLIEVVSEGLEAIKHIKDSGFIFNTRNLQYANEEFLEEPFSRHTSLFSRRYPDEPNYKENMIKNEFVFDFFAEDIKKIQKLLIQLEQKKGKLNIHKGMAFDLFASISDCPCGDGDCYRLSLSERVRQPELALKLAGELGNRRKKFFEDHKGEVEKFKEERDTSEKAMWERSQKLYKEKTEKANLEKFDPAI